MKILKFFLTICVMFLIHSCATVPVTGRKQLDLVSSSEINTMSATQYQDVIKKGPLSTNKEQTEMIKRVGSRIQKGVEQYMAAKGWSDQLAGFNWEFNLIQDDKTVNADRKSTRLNSSHQIISYAVFCLKKKIVEASTTTIDHIASYTNLR